MTTDTSGRLTRARQIQALTGVALAITATPEGAAMLCEGAASAIRQGIAAGQAAANGADGFGGGYADAPDAPPPPVNGKAKPAPKPSAAAKGCKRCGAETGIANNGHRYALCRECADEAPLCECSERRVGWGGKDWFALCYYCNAAERGAA